MIPAPSISQYDTVTAIFRPKNLETLKPKVKPFVGMIGTFQAMWIIETNDGQPEHYIGQWAMHVQDSPGHRWPFAWVALGDLEIVYGEEPI